MTQVTFINLMDELDKLIFMDATIMQLELSCAPMKGDTETCSDQNIQDSLKNIQTLIEVHNEAKQQEIRWTAQLDKSI
jgi:hypothetical protein